MSVVFDRVVELLELRQNAASANAVLRERRAAFDLEHANLIGLVRESSAAVQGAETALKAVALEEFSARGDKHVAPGVEIKMFKEYEIDMVAGLEWAKQKELCLIPASLDIPAVQKFAAVQKLPFVQVSEVPKVTIAADLSKVIPSKEEIEKEFDRPDRDLRTEKQDQAEARRDTTKSTRAYGR